MHEADAEGFRLRAARGGRGGACEVRPFYAVGCHGQISSADGTRHAAPARPGPVRLLPPCPIAGTHSTMRRRSAKRLNSRAGVGQPLAPVCRSRPVQPGPLDRGDGVSPLSLSPSLVAHKSLFELIRQGGRRQGWPRNGPWPVRLPAPMAIPGGRRVRTQGHSTHLGLAVPRPGRCGGRRGTFTGALRPWPRSHRAAACGGGSRTRAMRR